MSGGPRTPALGRFVALVAVVLGLADAAAGCDPAQLFGAPATSAPAAKRATAAAIASAHPVGERVMTFIDHTRTIKLPGRRPMPRRLVTVVRYPERVTGPVGLIVFGHGYAVTPAYYYRLLRAWAAAGYVVAAPVFPLGNAHAPGGPDEADIVNQPRDMSFVITRMLAASAGHSGPLAGLIDPARIAVAGQSDGGETALAVAYSSQYRDPRVRAALILSGAEVLGGRYFAPGSPPLLATQGTRDDINRPRQTYSFFAAARRPKYLLELVGAGHLPPYTYQQPQLGIVERVTIAFLDRYLEGDHGGGAAMRGAGDVHDLASLTARP